MIQLRKMGVREVTLMKDIFGFYLCRIWVGYDYVEYRSKNKFTAFRTAFFNSIYLLP